MELWKDITEFEGTYQISNYGRVRSLDREIVQSNPQKTGLSKRLLKGQMLKTKTTKFGYEEIHLYNRSTQTKHYVRIHQLVAKAFIPNTENKRYVNHIDADKKNNHVNNLEWCTAQENITHAHANNLITFRLGEKHQNTHLTKTDINYIRQNHKYRDKEFSAEALGRKFDVCTQTILNIVNRKIWKHID